jgi:hypothetical protein
MRQALVRRIVGLYPAAVRERYGDEIAELLRTSTRPGRDLADAACCAVLEHPASWTWRGARDQLSRMAWLAVAPLGFGVAMVLVAIAPLTIFAVLEEYAGVAVRQATQNLVAALCVVPVCAEAVWLGRRIAHGRRIAVPVLTVPGMLALGIVVIAGVPGFGALFGRVLSAVAAAVGCWCVTLIAVGSVGRRLVRRERIAAAVVVAAAGGLVALDMACAVYGRVAGLLGGDLVSALAVGPRAVTLPPGVLAGSLQGLPSVLTMCTAFALAVLVASPRPATSLGRRSPAA